MAASRWPLWAAVVGAVFLWAAPAEARFLKPTRVAAISTGSGAQQLLALGEDGHLYQKAIGGRWINRGEPWEPVRDEWGLAEVAYTSAEWAVYVVDRVRPATSIQAAICLSFAPARPAARAATAGVPWGRPAVSAREARAPVR